MSELHRFTRQLVESLSSHDPSAVGSPVSLEEIITRVLPYRACRRLFGILNVEDYEHLLLRLVAGEGGLAAASPLAAVERCRAELDMGHPDPGVVNELEGVTLRLDLGAIALGDVISEGPGGSIVRRYTLYEPEAEPEESSEVAAEPSPAADASDDPEAVADAPGRVAESDQEFPAPPEEEIVEFDFVDAPTLVHEDVLPPAEALASEPEPEPEADPFQELFDAPSDASEPEPGAPEPPPPAAAARLEPIAPPPPAAHGEPPPRCPHCASRLPSGRPVRFCPHCGSNVVPLQCVSCGAALEPAWRHCVLCGAPAVNDSRFA